MMFNVCNLFFRSSVEESWFSKSRSGEGNRILNLRMFSVNFNMMLSITVLVTYVSILILGTNVDI
jgi:hypothetical protein